MICCEHPWPHQAAMLSLLSSPPVANRDIYHQLSELPPAPAWLGNKLHKLIFTTISASNYGFYPPCNAYNPFGQLQLQHLADFMLLKQQSWKKSQKQKLSSPFIFLSPWTLRKFAPLVNILISFKFIIVLITGNQIGWREEAWYCPWKSVYVCLKPGYMIRSRFRCSC